MSYDMKETIITKIISFRYAISLGGGTKQGVSTYHTRQTVNL